MNLSYLDVQVEGDISRDLGKLRPAATKLAHHGLVMGRWVTDPPANCTFGPRCKIVHTFAHATPGIKHHRITIRITGFDVPCCSVPYIIDQFSNSGLPIACISFNFYPLSVGQSYGPIARVFHNTAKPFETCRTRMNDHPIEHAWVPDLVQYLKTTPQTTELQIDGRHLRLRDLTKIVSALEQYNRTLEILQISRTRLKDVGSATRLKSTHEPAYGDRGWKELAQRLSRVLERNRRSNDIEKRVQEASNLARTPKCIVLNGKPFRRRPSPICQLPAELRAMIAHYLDEATTSSDF